MPELDDVDMDLVSEMLKSKRGSMSLRKAAESIGVSAPTLQRLEAKQVPTASSLVKIAQWLGVSVDDLRRSDKAERRRSTVEQIEVYLRADPDLDKEAAATIANVVKQVYDGFRKKKKAKR
jgi:transcriptional regulator with XRE-family HTH domain